MESKKKRPIVKSIFRHWLIVFGMLYMQGIQAQTHSLPVVLEALSQHYQIFFSYDADLLAKEQIQFEIDETETAAAAVKRLLSIQGLSYDCFENIYYVIYQGEQEKLADPPPTITKQNKIKIFFGSLLIDEEEGFPIADAFIFIRNTSISTTSDLSGTFSLEVSDFSRGELVITHLNYKTRTFALAEVEHLPETIRLSPKNLAFAEVKVKAKRLRSKKRKQWMKQFTKALFGEGNNKRGMKILNPEVVWFQEKEGVLLAEAVDYLSIYNPSLGYQLRFYLETFRTDAANHTDYIGKVFFEDKKKDLTLEKQRNSTKIERRRQKTFKRSKKYFFRSLLAGEINPKQFLFGEAILDDNRQVIFFNPLTLDSLTIKRGPFQDTLLTDNFFAFTNKKIVTEWGRSSALNNYATCFLFAENGQIIIDHSGEIVNAKEIIEIGYWTGRRLADLMPMEYNFVRPIIEQPEAEDVVSNLANKVVEFPQEKVYLHLNKPYYSLTESIWFKAYLVNAHNHSQNTLSKVVYVDLIDPVGEITKSWTLHKDKVMDGDFRFNSLSKAGQYQIRAYTQYMRNEAPEFFFQRSFLVYDYSVKQASTIIEKADKLFPSSKVQVDFFPEGGELIDGLSNNIAFKLTDSEGKALNAAGRIIDELGQMVGKIKTQHEGLGLFNLQPIAEKNYTAIIDFEGKEYSFKLPEGQMEGMVMRVNNRDAVKLFIEIQATDANFLEGAFLVGHVRGQIFCFLEDLDETAPIVFSKKSLPTGVAHFTLFNANLQPLAERLVFNEVGITSEILSVIANKKKYQARELVELEVSSEALQKNANLSLSITDQSVVNYAASEENLPSYLLLNADLPYPIPNPNFYLTVMDNPKRYWLDLLMMTYGWRRFNWRDLLESDKKMLTFLPETGYSLKGYTTEKKNPQKRISTQVLLTSLNEEFIYESQTTDVEGNFHFRNLPYLDSISFIIQGRIQNRKNALNNDAEKMKLEGERMIDFHFESMDRPPILNNKLRKTKELDRLGIEKYLSYEKHSNTLDSIYNSIWKIDFDQAVVVKAKRKQRYKYGEMYDLNQMDWVHPQKMGTSLMSFLYPRFNYEVDFQRGKLYLVQGFTKTPLSISINGMGADRNGSNPARFLSLSADIINTIYFNKKCSCIAITTRGIPRSLQIKLESGILNVDHPGYLKARTFYAPNYAQDLPIHQAPDLRTAIHWVPNIQLVENQPTKVSFYTADTPTTYEIRVEGITTDGVPIFKTVNLEVRE